MRTILPALVIAAFASACGQTGDLYLPEKESEPAPAPASAEIEALSESEDDAPDDQR